MLLGLLISLSSQKLDATVKIIFNLKYYTPIISGHGGLKFNLVVEKLSAPGTIHCWVYNNAETTQSPILVKAGLGITANSVPHLPPPHIFNAAEMMKTPTFDYFPYCLLLWELLVQAL